MEKERYNPMNAITHMHDMAHHYMHNMAHHIHDMVHHVSVAVGHEKTDEPPSVATPTKAEIYARAEQQMRHGKELVIGGYIVAVVGIVGYCVASFSAAVNPDLGAALLESPRWLFAPTLGIIGLGTLLWLVGSFIYLNGAMDSDPNGPDLDF
jgi:hypothetical protein